MFNNFFFRVTLLSFRTIFHLPVQIIYQMYAHAPIEGGTFFF